jgi:hypothetical protein
MKLSVSITIFFLIAVSAVSASADLDYFMAELNVQARKDMTGFSSGLATHFGVPVPDVQMVLDTVAFPADAFMCLQLSLMTHQPLDVVIRSYRRHQGNGWGVIAKELGIKPGSEEFHVLKNGRFSFPGTHRGKSYQDRGNGNTRGKDKNRGKGRDK